MEHRRNPEIILTYNPYRRRNIGRPRVGWRDQDTFQEDRTNYAWPCPWRTRICCWWWWLNEKFIEFIFLAWEGTKILSLIAKYRDHFLISCVKPLRGSLDVFCRDVFREVCIVQPSRQCLDAAGVACLLLRIFPTPPGEHLSARDLRTN